MAVSILIVILTPASATAVTGLRGIRSMREFTVAESLAREGAEGIRILKETNALRLSADVAGCWNIKDDLGITSTEDCADPNNKLVENSYIVSVNTLDQIGRISVTSAGADILDLSNGPDESFRLYVNRALGIYTHDSAPADQFAATDFFRAVTISYTDSSIMDVSSKVEWIGSGGKAYHITVNDSLSAVE